MNVILIPFFLTANMVVNDISEWKFGPEYSYNLNITYDIIEDNFGPYKAYFNSTVKCQPKQSEILFCRLDNTTVSVHLRNRSSTGNRYLEKTFAIKFNEHGIEALLIEPPFTRILVNIIRKIANQLSMDVNEMRNTDVQSISQYMRKENTSMGNCMTRYVIKRKELEANAIKKDINFQLEVLPSLRIAKPQTKLSIFKIRSECVNSPNFVDIFKDEIFEMERFSSVVLIDDGYKAWTIMSGYIRPPNKSTSNSTFFEEIEFNLDRIKPAESDYFSTFRGEVIDLNINTGIPDNFMG